MKEDELLEVMASKYPNMARGDKAYPGLYQRELSELMARMSLEDKAEMQEVQAEWEAIALPIDVRLRCASKIIKIFPFLTCLELHSGQEIRQKRNCQHP